MAARRDATASTGRKPSAPRSAQRRTTTKRKSTRPTGKTTPRGGRPPYLITEEHVRQIEVLAGLGLTEAAIAAVLEMHPDTFRAKKNAPVVSRALARGKAKAEMTVGTALFNRARGGDVKAITWWEMTRANRSARSHVVNEELPTLRVVRGK